MAPKWKLILACIITVLWIILIVWAITYFSAKHYRSIGQYGKAAKIEKYLAFMSPHGLVQSQLKKNAAGNIVNETKFAGNPPAYQHAGGLSPPYYGNERYGTHDSAPQPQVVDMDDPRNEGAYMIFDAMTGRYV